jgi:predicted Zn-dependent protease
MKKSVFHLLTLATLLLASCQKVAFNGLPEGELSHEEEKTLGTILRNAILGDTLAFPILTSETNDCSTRYMGLIIRTLVERDMLINAALFNWTIDVLADEANATAFTLPGGHIFITKGLIDNMLDESELVAVIVHEMAYADRGHATKLLLRTFGSQAISDILEQQISPKVSPQSIARAMPALAFSPEIVKEADVFAGQLLCPYAYKAASMATFLEHTAQSGAKLAWLESRPSYPNRIRFLKSYSNQSSCQGEKTFTSRFEAYKNTCLIDLLHE